MCQEAGVMPTSYGSVRLARFACVDVEYLIGVQLSLLRESQPQQ